MSWNEYKYVTRKVGCRLRVSCLPEDIAALAPTGEEISSVRVEGREDGRAVLQVWSYVPGSRNFGSIRVEDGKFNRYTVTVVSVPENPEWVVEGNDFS